MEQAGSVAQRSEASIKRISLLWTYLPPVFPAIGVEPALTEFKHAEGAFGLKLHFANAKNSDEVRH